MSGIFSKPKYPSPAAVAPPVAPPAPAPIQKEDVEQEKDKIIKGATKGGKKKTILTSSRGILTPPRVGLKSLLGGSE